MRKIKIALSLIVIALVIFVLVMALNKWSFKNLSNQKYTTNTYEITENFENIIIDITTADIKILPSADDKCKIEAYEEIDRTHKIESVNERLTITPPQQKLFPSIFNFDSPKITIYLPIKEYQILQINAATGDILIDKAFSFASLNIDVTTGNIECYASSKENIVIEATTGNIILDNVVATSLSLKATTGVVTVKNTNCIENVNIDLGTGKADLTSIRCKNLTARGTTRATTLNDVIASEKLNLKRTTGNITLNNCDASEIYIKVTTGNVSGNLLTGKTFDVQTTTGNKNVPATTGGMCKIEATTGDIDITVSQSE